MNERDDVRARALRAARVVTLGLAIASVPACGGRTHSADEDSGTPGTDSGVVLADSGAVDAGPVGEDGGHGHDHDAGGGALDAGSPYDSGLVADAGTNTDAGLPCPDIFPPATRECCEATPGGHWDEASMECWVAVPGPFVPPSETAHV